MAVVRISSAEHIQENIVKCESWWSWRPPQLVLCWVGFMPSFGGLQLTKLAVVVYDSNGIIKLEALMLYIVFGDRAS